MDGTPKINAMDSAVLIRHGNVLRDVSVSNHRGLAHTLDAVSWGTDRRGAAGTTSKVMNKIKASYLLSLIHI